MSAARDPFDRLATALADVVRSAVAEALAGLATGATDTAELLSVEEAARRLSLGTTTLKRKIAAGDIESVLVDRRRLIPASAIRDYVTHLCEKVVG